MADTSPISGHCEELPVQRRSNPEALENFGRDGYAIVRGLIPSEDCAHMLDVARSHLARAVAPLEYEADLQYPGAPVSREVAGGRTVRRLLQAYARDAAFARCATSSALASYLRTFLGS